MKTAIICNTPYQILNMLNLFYHDKRYGEIDMFLINRFSTADKIYNRLKNTDLFKNVYFISPTRGYNMSKASSLLKLVFPEKYKDQYDVDDWGIIKNDYEYLFIGDLEPFGRIIEASNPNIKVYVYDDGASFYFGNAFYDYKNNIRRTIERVFKLGVSKSNIQGLYINSKDICKSIISENIIQLPCISDEGFSRFAKKVFEYKKNTALIQHRYLIMDFPMERIDEYNGFDLVDFLLKHEGLNCILRYHPCSEPLNKELLAIDEIGNSWELECLNCISDDHVLIGYYSTSQLMPKIIADKEPYVIYTYKLMLKKEGEYRFSEYAKFINLVKDKYRDKSKIYIPNNEEELLEVLSYIDSRLDCYERK